ncbi:MAG: HAMP domain-containing protein [Lachnospiraceae bacterium]|nr:HAMP domain-containing protein [Lachnospiraceae bacterium]
MKRKFGLRMKFTLLFLGFTLLITAAVFAIIEYNNETIIRSRFYDYAVSIGSLAASMVTAEEVELYREQLNTPGQIETNKEYQETLRELERIRDRTGIHYLYVICPVSETKGIYIFDAETENETDAPGKQETYRPGDAVDLRKGGGFDKAWRVMRGEETDGQFEFESGLNAKDGLASVFVPIRDESGNGIAFVGVDMDIEEIWDSIRLARDRTLGALLLLMAGCGIFLLLLTRFSVIWPVRRLKASAEQLAEGRFGEALPVRGHDELSEITDVFNRMSKNIRGHLEEIQRINQAYYKYVPSELLDIFGKESITRAELGDQADRAVTILAFELAAAGEYMPARDGRQIMADMNELFRTVIPAIMERKGFVQDFRNTSMEAVYTDGAAGAVLSAISICQKLNSDGGQRRAVSPKISMGIDHGSVLFGIVGQEKRMSAVSISAHTSMAEQLRRLATRYGARLLITAAAAEQIPDFRTAYRHRFIGMAENKYDGTAEKIYDVYDGDSEEQREGKERTREQFEEGVELFCMRRFRESRRAFVAVLKRFREDRGAKRYLQYCNQYYQAEDEDDISIFLSEG